MANKSDGNAIPKSSSLPSDKIHPSNDPEIDPSSYVLEKFMLHETQQRFYIIGSDRRKRFFRVLKIDRSEAAELNISEDPVVYSQEEVKSLLQRIAEGNRSTGGLQFVAKFYGVAGCVKFLESYYLILVTKRRQIGSICGHRIYSIEERQYITIPHATVQTDVAHSKTELRYKKLFSSMDLTKDFFFSYTYPVMQSLQKNVLSNGKSGMPYENMFVWNAYLTEGIRSRCKNNIWTIALVHGHFKQMRMSIFGHIFTVTLVSRRSRHFAGTRYLKRGLNDKGRVANDVETEQIILDEEPGLYKGKMSSVVQMRGSIPLFWSQEAAKLSPKPDIKLHRYDPTYDATKKHFEDIEERYGNPIIVLNLIKTFEKRPREMMLRREFTNAVGYLNQILPEEKHVKFIHWDFHKFAKTKSANVLAVLGAVADEALDLTGFYYSGKSFVRKNGPAQLRRSTILRDSSLKDLSRIGSSATLNTLAYREKDCEKEIYVVAEPRFQSGVLRTNCIDCLDRTNVAQYAFGLAALGRQLHTMGLTATPKVDPDSSIAANLMDMYQGMGDSLAHQYGGSAAHNTVFPDRQGKWRAATQSQELFKSIKRYYSNAYTDGEKQGAINLFLGYYKPQEGKPPLWELDSDYFLHVSGVGDEPLPNQSSSEDTIAMPAIAGLTFEPIPAFKEDFSRLKLTSVEKLIERTCSSIKSVRISSESDDRSCGGNGTTSGVAPDAAEIQLKSPNWLFGQRKDQENPDALKIASCPYGGSQERTPLDLTWLSTNDYIIEEDMFERDLATTVSVDEANGWYGGTLLDDPDENSEVYKHYHEIWKGPSMEVFESDSEKEQYFANVVRTQSIENTDYAEIKAEMEAFLKESDKIEADIGIIPTCKSFTGDASQLARWLIGEESFSQ